MRWCLAVKYGQINEEKSSFLNVGRYVKNDGLVGRIKHIQDFGDPYKKQTVRKENTHTTHIWSNRKRTKRVVDDVYNSRYLLDFCC